jgi:outer membrane protein TolC
LPALLFCALFTSGLAAAQQQQTPLPSPLSLAQALQLADQSHPDLILADAALEQARARLLGVEAEDDSRLDLTAALRAIDPSPLAEDRSANDSFASLRLSKQLYDFGRTQRARAAADARVQDRQMRLLATRQQRRLQVMERFFTVLLADLEHARDNEAMSIAYVRLDRGRSRHELKQLSDVALLELEERYQQSRVALSNSQNRQRITRSLLAISLNRPNDLPSELEKPAAVSFPALEEYEVLLGRVLAGNPLLLAHKAGLEAAQQQLREAEAQDNPVLRGELEAATYARDLGGRNPLTAALVVDIPLYTGSRQKSLTAQRQAELRQQQATLAAYELELRQQVLELWLELKQLENRRQELKVTGDFRDLYLERSRTLYDFEVASDLGDSMVQIADLYLLQAENELQTRLLWARLEALSGSLLMSEAAGTTTNIGE